MQEDELLREELRFWKGQVNSGIVPAMSIDIFMDISNLQRGEYLVLEDQSTKRRHRISPESLMTTDHDGKVGYCISLMPVTEQFNYLSNWQSLTI